MKNAKGDKRSVVEIDLIVWKKIERAAMSKNITPEAYASFLLSRGFNQPNRKTA